MNEKRFQEVLEEVAYQRAFYREQRAQQLEEEQEKQVWLSCCRRFGGVILLPPLCPDSRVDARAFFRFPPKYGES